MIAVGLEEAAGVIAQQADAFALGQRQSEKLLDAGAMCVEGPVEPLQCGFVDFDVRRAADVLLQLNLFVEYFSRFRDADVIRGESAPQLSASSAFSIT